jgi:hypothetical protein
MHQSEKSVFITVIHVWSNETKIDTEMNMTFSFLKLWSAFSVHLKSVFFCTRVIIDMIRLKVLNELSIEVCKVYETLYTLYWFKDLSVHDCLHLLRIHLYIFFTFRMNFKYLIDLTSNSHLSMSICSWLLKVIVVSFIHDFSVDAAIHQWK